MKTRNLFMGLILTMSVTQGALASECDIRGPFDAVAGYLAIASITSAPTGTTILLSSHCMNRDAILNLKEAAIKYRMTGEVNPILQEGLREGKKANPELSEEEILSKFIAVDLQE